MMKSSKTMKMKTKPNPMVTVKNASVPKKVRTVKARVKAASDGVGVVVAAVVTSQAKARFQLEALKAKLENPLKALARMKVKARKRLVLKGKPRLKLKPDAVAVADAAVVVADVKVKPCAWAKRTVSHRPKALNPRLRLLAWRPSMSTAPTQMHQLAI
jgi:hypothetical protein